MHILAVSRPMLDQDGLLMLSLSLLGPLGAILWPSGGHFWPIMCLLVLSFSFLYMLLPSWVYLVSIWAILGPTCGHFEPQDLVKMALTWPQVRFKMTHDSP